MKSEESPGNRLRGEGGEERERECVSERRGEEERREGAVCSVLSSLRHLCHLHSLEAHAGSSLPESHHHRHRDNRDSFPH